MSKKKASKKMLLRSSRTPWGWKSPRPDAVGTASGTSCDDQQAPLTDRGQADTDSPLLNCLTGPLGLSIDFSLCSVPLRFPFWQHLSHINQLNS